MVVGGVKYRDKVNRDIDSMIDMVELKTERLILRQWHQNDLTDFAALNADSEVMKFFSYTMNKKESDELAEKIISRMNNNGWGFWAVETISDHVFIGFVGLNKPSYDVPVDPCVEIGWRLAKQYWGQGYATEAAKAALAFAFNKLELCEVYSFAAVGNQRSRAVMERLNMVNTSISFQHPMMPENSKHKEHVLYKIDRKQWLEKQV